MKVYVWIGNIKYFDFDFNLLILSKCLNFVFIFENNYILGMVFFYWVKINYVVSIFFEGYEKKGVLFVMIDCVVFWFLYKYWCGWVILFLDGWLKDM